MRRWLIIGAAAVAAGLVGASAVTKVIRDREWANGGKGLAAQVEYRVADESGLPVAVRELGGPSRHAASLPFGKQAVVARLSWHGPDPGAGQYHLVLLDRRTEPNRLLTGYECWNDGGDTGIGWDEKYRELAQHYDWAAATAASPEVVDPGPAISATASAQGTLVAVYLVGDEQPPVLDPRQDLIAAVFLTDSDGKPRWAKKL